MAVHSRGRQRLPTHLIPRFLVGTGLIALLTFLSLFSTNTSLLFLENADIVTQFGSDQLIQTLLIGIPALGLIYTGYWLHAGWFSSEQVWHVGIAAAGAATVAGTCTGLSLVLFPVGPLTVFETFSLFVSTSAGGSFVGVLVGVFAVTDAIRRRGRELEVQSDRFRYVERMADIGYWELDPTAAPPYPLDVSDGWYRLHGLSSDEPIDVESGLNCYHPEDRPRVEAAIERALTEREPFDTEARLDTERDPCRWIHIVGEPVTDGGEVVRIRGTIQDVTEQKKYEREIERHNERLDRFAGVISHDLRNPLNVAEGRLELAREECDSDHLDAVAQAHGRMGALIEDLLTLARGNDTAPELEPVALADLVEACWQTVATAEATLVIATDGTVRADRNRLQQLLENLIRNSVEHAGPDVTVTVGELPDGFYVADDGPGIPEPERETVFETGYSMSSDGTGLGLSIVQEIVGEHGWEIEVRASENRGARFEVTGVEFAE